MRFAYIVGTYPQPSETFIAREMEGLRARGHQVDVFSLFQPPDGPLDGVAYGWTGLTGKVLHKAGGEGAIRMLGRRWRTMFAAQGIDAVVAHFGSLPSTVALEAAGDLPLFISLHARDIYVEAEKMDEKLSRAAAVVTCTQANVEYLRTHFPTYSDKIHLIYHGLPRTWLDAPPPERQRTPDEPLRLLAVGRLVEKKGFVTLLQACAELQVCNVPFSLRIIGDGPFCNLLQNEIKRLSLDGSVSLPGWASQDAVRAAYAWADVFCCPSIITADGDRDGLPNVLVEAMSTGLPAIGTAISGIPEAIEDGVTGLLVPPDDVASLTAALTRYAVNPDLRATHGTAAAQCVRERFDRERWLDKLEALLKNVR
ncbi:MAG: glycosyltransferase family 4 protein [Armatimonadota bacterium]